MSSSRADPTGRAPGVGHLRRNLANLRVHRVDRGAGAARVLNGEEMEPPRGVSPRLHPRDLQDLAGETDEDRRVDVRMRRVTPENSFEKGRADPVGSRAASGPMREGAGRVDVGEPFRLALLGKFMPRSGMTMAEQLRAQRNVSSMPDMSRKPAATGPCSNGSLYEDSTSSRRD